MWFVSVRQADSRRVVRGEDVGRFKHRKRTAGLISLAGVVFAPSRRRERASVVPTSRHKKATDISKVASAESGGLKLRGSESADGLASRQRESVAVGVPASRFAMLATTDLVPVDLAASAFPE